MRESDCFAWVVNGTTSAQPSSGSNAPLTPVTEVSGDMINPPASDVGGNCGGDSSSDLSSGPMSPPSKPVRDADKIDSHRVATADTCVVADELKQVALRYDNLGYHMTGSPLSDGVGCNHFALHELLFSS